MLKRTVLGMLLLVVMLMVAACAMDTPVDEPGGEAPIQGPGDDLNDDDLNDDGDDLNDDGDDDLDDDMDDGGDDDLDDDGDDDMDDDGDDDADDSAGLPPAAVLEAQQLLADQLGVSAGDIRIVSTEQVQWPDACLGLPDQGEMCAQVITPGWNVMFEVNGEQYEVHTDELGAQVRVASDV